MVLACPVFAATRLVLLGTGTPRQDPERFGPASAIVFNNNAYIFDAGVGVVRRAAAAKLHNVPALPAPQLQRVFITHLHSDHTLGLPDLIFSPWVVGRKAPLEIWGPKGTQAMVSDIEAAWSADVDIRIHGLEHGNETGYRTIVHEIDPGFVYRDGALTITAIPVHHGSWPQAYGYRIQTPDRVIVLSGDCAPSPDLPAKHILPLIHRYVESTLDQFMSGTQSPDATAQHSNPSRHDEYFIAVSARFRRTAQAKNQPCRKESPFALTDPRV